jgi:hypothetical protein
MSTLTTLKAAAASKLATAETDVKAYVAELEASVKANKILAIGCAAVGALVGAVVGHLV